ncbi:TRAP transporter small permease [Terrihabitans rhizophilus]|uniref:TRAP transporter small permease protein n=1 Tax=Terrihabitans rhizophilus TaxID=3092662 RepID=A0ABU4RN08_9HYPH|nr:TRAP transporter small permease [Terrihabitans sp. PJ23]MDX6806212.1 TRAP transporter small permease [Terrihabitans sp. PJ23]
MSYIVDVYFWILKILVAFLMAAMVVLVFGNVVLRYGFNSGITLSEEVSRWMFVWLTFLGAIIAMRERGHLGVDSLVRRLPLWGKKLCFTASYLLMLYATSLLFIGSWQQTLINWDVVAPASGLSVAFFYGVGLVFGVSTIPILLVGLYRALAGELDAAKLVTVQESEEGNIDEIQERHLASPAGAPVLVAVPVTSRRQP